MALMAALTLLLTDLVAAHASAQLARVRVLRSAVLWACAERIVKTLSRWT